MPVQKEGRDNRQENADNPRNQQLIRRKVFRQTMSRCPAHDASDEGSRDQDRVDVGRTFGGKRFVDQVPRLNDENGRYRNNQNRQENKESLVGRFTQNIPGMDGPQVGQQDDDERNERRLNQAFIAQQVGKKHQGDIQGKSAQSGKQEKVGQGG